MSQACENFVQSKVVSIGNFDVVEKTGYPTVIDIQNAGFLQCAGFCLENGLKWENGTCKYSAEQCTVKSSQTCLKDTRSSWGWQIEVVCFYTRRYRRLVLFKAPTGGSMGVGIGSDYRRPRCGLCNVFRFKKWISPSKKSF